MICKCSYYRYDEKGQLVCSVCGRPAKPALKVEDKIANKPETKEVSRRK